MRINRGNRKVPCQDVGKAQSAIRLGGTCLAAAENCLAIKPDLRAGYQIERAIFHRNNHFANADQGYVCRHYLVLAADGGA